MLGFHQVWSKIFFSLLLLLLTPFTIVTQTKSTDALAYFVNNFDGKIDLMLYDPLSQTSSLLLNNIDPYHFTFSNDRHLAFSLNQADNADTYILDAQATNSSPINITQNPDADDYPLSWSPDGRYLAFASYQRNQNHSAKLYILDTRTANSSPVDITQKSNANNYTITWSPNSHYLAFASYQANNASLYVWNGETAVNITPDVASLPIHFYELSWSLDERLAFTVQDKNDKTEIFLWDGKTSTDLSQNPLGDDMGSV